jgi:hypothetical protein
MINIAKEIDEIIEVYKRDFSDLDEQITSYRLDQDKWTLKEIIGHLIDSASNNHQRFIRFQLSDELEFPDYKRSEWLRIENHQKMQFNDLLSLFYFYNKLIINIVLNIDESSLKRKWNVPWDENSSYITFEDLLAHYVRHLKDHLAHFRERLMELEKELSR